MPEKKPDNRLTDINPFEVSLVDRPANKKRFLLLKAEEGEIMADKETPLTEEAKKSLLALKEIKGLPEDFVKRAGELAEGKDSIPSDPPADPPKEPVSKEAKETDKVVIEKVELETTVKRLEEQNVTLTKQVEELSDTLTKETDARRLAELVMQAEKEFPFAAGTPKERAEQLLKLEKQHPESAKALVETFKTASTAISQATGLLIPVGSDRDSASTSKGKIEEIARGYMEKDINLTKEQAITKAYESNPALYDG